MEEWMAPKKVKGLLVKHDFRFKKSLGQNFLTDKNILQKITQVADLKSEDSVLEVGPGAGALTQFLAQKAQKVTAIELDRSLLPILQESLKDFSNVTIVQADILKTDIGKHLEDKSVGQWKVVANLPYYITTPVIMRFLEEHLPIASLTVMVQKEVADRMTAKPGGKDYGNLSVVVQYYTEAKLALVVPRTVFMPQPEVDSAVIHLKIRENPPVEVLEEKDFFRVVKAAFAQRRKTLRNCLSNGLGLEKQQIESIFLKTSIDGGRRGETLSLEEFSRLANQFTRLKRLSFEF